MSTLIGEMFDLGFERQMSCESREFITKSVVSKSLDESCKRKSISCIKLSKIVLYGWLTTNPVKAVSETLILVY